MTKSMRGYSIVELMISVAIGLALATAATYLFVAGIRSYGVAEESSQLHEQGRFILNYLGQNIRSAGFFHVKQSSDAGALFSLGMADNDLKFKDGAAISGCRYGYANPNASTQKFSCATSGAASTPESIEFRYYTDDYDATFQRGTDCNGNNAGGTASNLVENRFFVARRTMKVNGNFVTVGELRCSAAGGVAQPLFQGVEDLKFLYGLSPTAARDVENVSEYQTAEKVNDWTRVISVRVCVLMRSMTKGTGLAGQKYLDCSGIEQTNSDNYVWKAFTATYTLQNRVRANPS